MQSTQIRFFGVSSLVFVTAASMLVAAGCSDKLPSSGGSGNIGGSAGAGGAPDSSSSSISTGVGGIGGTGGGNGGSAGGGNGGTGGGNGGTGGGNGGTGGGNGGTGGSGGGVPFAGGLLVVGKGPSLPQSLYRYTMDGTMFTELVNGSYSRVVMSANRTRFAAYYAVRTVIMSDVDGGNQALLAFPNLVDHNNSAIMAMSASGQYIVYAREETMPTLSIYVAPTDGSAGELLFTGEGSFWAWSPKENKLVYGGLGAPLRMYDLDTKTKVDLTSTQGNANTVKRAWWSKDGERLAFIENLPNDMVAASVDKYGQNRRVLLTNLDSFQYSKWGEWSPDGQYFALMYYLSSQYQVLLVDANGTMTRDLVDDFDSVYLGPSSWSPTNHYVYVTDDGSIKSATLSGTTLTLVGPGYGGDKRLGANGRVMYCDPTLGCGTIGADGSNPITYLPDSVGTEVAAMSPDGKTFVFTPKPDAAKNVPIYAASSESAGTTLVTTLQSQFYSPYLSPLAGSSGVTFDGVNVAGWIVPTPNGLKAIYPQPGMEYLSWAHSLE